jgi:hypothetical protein
VNAVGSAVDYTTPVPVTPTAIAVDSSGAHSSWDPRRAKSARGSRATHAAEVSREAIGVQKCIPIAAFRCGRSAHDLATVVDGGNLAGVPPIAPRSIYR